MFLSNVTIRTKIFVAFGLILAITLALGGFAIDRLSRVNSEAGEIRNKWLPATQIIAKMSLFAEQYRIAEGRALVSASAEATQAVEADLKTRAQEVLRQRAAYEATPMDDAARNVAREFDRYWAEYMAVSQETLALMRHGAKDQAADIYNGRGRTPVGNARASAAKLMDLNVQGGNAAAMRGEQVFLAAKTRIIGALALAALLCCLAAIIVVGGVSKPVLAMARTMQRLADGDNDVEVAGIGRKDEIGVMARAVGTVRARAVERARLEAAQVEEGRRAIEETRKAALIDMADRIETETTTALHEVGTRTAAMTATAEEMSASAARTGASAQSAATASAQALANAQTVASAAEELSASISEIGSQVAQSTAVVGRAVAAGTETRATIETLNEQVARIGAVADMIGEIAAKTNLLALNATIEAARAGDAGKGFAVVASEVKALATQTAQSTKEIAQHIGQVSSATGASVAAVKEIEKTIGEIKIIANSIAAAVEEQGVATAEIARNVTETATAANDMASHSKVVASEAEQTGMRAAEVREDAAALNTAVGELRHSVIRVVRTSTADVDRRRFIRQQVDLRCRLSVPGQAAGTARVTDISEAGARVRGGPSVQLGTRGTMHLDAAGCDLPFVVREAEGDALRVTFEMDESSAARFRLFLDRLDASRAA
jgi:methyl-accepting chemotaxis protein